jgi:hypothetical protein
METVFMVIEQVDEFVRTSSFEEHYIVTTKGIGHMLGVFDTYEEAHAWIEQAKGISSLNYEIREMENRYFMNENGHLSLA